MGHSQTFQKPQSSKFDSMLSSKKHIYCAVFAVPLMAFNAGSCFAAIQVFSAGTQQSFNTFPFPSDTWTTSFLLGSSDDVMNESNLDGLIQSTSSNAFVSPITLGSGDVGTRPHWTDAGNYVYTYPNLCAAVGLMAKLENATGGMLPSLTVSFDLGRLLDNGEFVAEEIPGLRVYYSLTGSENSWSAAGTFSLPGRVNVNLPLGNWAGGSSLYVIWVDDNAVAAPTTGEAAYTIDNVRFVPVPEPSSALLAIIAAAGVSCALRARTRMALLAIGDEISRRA